MRAVFEELKFFLIGDTNSNHLSEKGVKIWDANTTREFLNKCNLQHYEPGTLGPMYGFNWSFFGAKYNGPNEDYTGKGVNQLAYIVNLLIHDKYSRRILMTTFNPATVAECVLWPCHGIVVQFGCVDNKLNCTMYQR